MTDDAQLNPEHGESSESSAPTRPLTFWHYCLLAVPFVGLLIPPLYASSTPEIFGIPFFYAYQFLWIILSSAITGLVYRAIYR